jgi:hypothetical protein
LSHDSHPDPSAVARFITRWEASGSAERANYTMFLTELCVLIKSAYRLSHFGFSSERRY